MRLTRWKGRNGPNDKNKIRQNKSSTRKIKRTKRNRAPASGKQKLMKKLPSRAYALLRVVRSKGALTRAFCVHVLIYREFNLCFGGVFCCCFCFREGFYRAPLIYRVNYERVFMRMVVGCWGFFFVFEKSYHRYLNAGIVLLTNF